MTVGLSIDRIIRDLSGVTGILSWSLAYLSGKISIRRFDQHEIWRKIELSDHFCQLLNRFQITGDCSPYLRDYNNDTSVPAEHLTLSVKDKTEFMVQRHR